MVGSQQLQSLVVMSSFMIVMSMGFLISSSEATNFIVGGKDGWVLNPSEDYNHWAKRTRFQVNDTLTFKYNKGTDSVLFVTKEDYEKCNTSNPIKGVNDGDSTFTLGRSGPFFFISGNQECCEKGQKVMVVVMSEHKAGSSGTSPPSAGAPSSESPIPSTPSSSSSTNVDQEAPAPAPSSAPPSFTSSTSIALLLVSGLVSLLVMVVSA